MLKLIIADDERIIRETISEMINWEELGIEVVGVCKDGVEAYHKFLDESPDIIMTDIRMPGLSGLELVKKVVEMNSCTQCMILSGYEEFEYAREAMRYGVRHYLLKPCDEKQIVEEVRQVVKDVQDIKKRLSEKEEHDIIRQTLHQDAMYHLLRYGIYMEPEKLEEYGDEWGKLTESYGQYFDFYYQGYELYYLYFLEPQKLEEVFQILRQGAQTGSCSNLYGIYVKNTLVLYCPDRSWQAWIEQAALSAEKCQTEKCEFRSLKELLSVIWRKTRRYDEVYVIHNFRLLSISNNQNVSRYIRLLFQQFKDSETKDAESLCKELRASIERVTQEEFLRWVAESIGIQFSSLNVFSMTEVAEFMMEVNQRESLTAIRQSLLELVARGEKRMEEDARDTKGISRSVIEYVETHLSNQNLTLKEIAENHLYMNVDYVSRRFQKETGKKFSQYLAERRIKKAKDLLSGRENVKIQYVAEKVGCGSSPQYFSQIFKKMEGVTPSKWVQITRLQ